MTSPTKRAAHFLLMPELAYSPANEAVICALLECGYEVDIYAPGELPEVSAYGKKVQAKIYEYGRRWLFRHLVSPRWRQYRIFSANAEKPFAIVGLLSFLHRRKLVLVVDEIMSGTYWGNDPAYMKRLHRWAMRRADLCIVNDRSRILLLQEYADIDDPGRIAVQPNCFREPPQPLQRRALRDTFGIPEDALTIGVSGGFNETAGAEWLFEAFGRIPALHILLQPVGMAQLSQLLLRHISGSERVYLRTEHLGWRGAWTTVPAVDIGLAIYLNPAPQFQNMGISSNRLCMYLTMGVPVITSRQDSFKFVEEYDCGVMVGSLEEFIAAVEFIRERLPEMRANAIRCAREYINASGRYEKLKQRIAGI